MNVMLTSVGRRSYLVDYFKNAVGEQGKIIGVNSELHTSGMARADQCHVVPDVNSPGYIPALLEICRREQVQLVVSLFDIDLKYLAQASEEFLAIGTQVAVSDSWVIDLANDKWSTYCFLREHDLPTPGTYLGRALALQANDVGYLDFPVVVKPRWGMGSLSIHVAHDRHELTFFCDYVKRQIGQSYLNILSSQDMEHAVIVQQFVDGLEYGVDVFNDLSGQHLKTVVKKKIAMRSGETDMAMTVDNTLVEELAGRVGRLLGHRGNLDIDIMVPSGLDQPQVLELNARFGGGYPFSHLAGVDFPRALIALAAGQEVDSQWLSHRSGIKGLKSITPVTFPSGF